MKRSEEPMPEPKSEGERTPRAPTREELLEELRRSRGEAADRPSEQEPPPPHYGRSGSGSSVGRHGEE